MRTLRSTRGGATWPRQYLSDFPLANPQSIALTIDDGPTIHTRRILELLDDLQVRATFFVIGECAAKFPDLVIEMLDRGHNLGIHGWTHTRFPRLSAQELREELKRTQDALPTPVTMVRPPYGDFDVPVLTALEEACLDVVGWSAYCEDWRHERTRGDLAAELVADVRPGDIILLHDIAGATVTLEAVVPALSMRGLAWTRLDSES